VEPKNDHTPSEQPRQPELAPAPKKRFQLVKLEERIAPTYSKGYMSGTPTVSSYQSC
jgi:hypothetical protein